MHSSVCTHSLSPLSWSEFSPGAFNQGWIAEKISRKYSICVAVCIFVVGSVLQTAAQDYAMLIVGRLIGGVGIGMCVLPLPLKHDQY